MATFTIAVNEGEIAVSFFNCIIFGKLAEATSNFLTKGKRVAVVGSLHQNRYTDKEGNNKQNTQIKVFNLQFLDGSQRDHSH